MQRLIPLLAIGLVLAGAALAYAPQPQAANAASPQTKLEQQTDTRSDEQKRADRRAANARLEAARIKAKGASPQPKEAEEEVKSSKQTP